MTPIIDLPHVDPDRRELKSYVWHHESDKCFFVSTIDRPSSAEACYGSRYKETIAWEYDWATQKRGNVVAHCGDGPAFKQHMDVCKQLYEAGVYND